MSASSDHRRMPAGIATLAVAAFVTSLAWAEGGGQPAAPEPAPGAEAGARPGGTDQRMVQATSQEAGQAEGQAAEETESEQPADQSTGTAPSAPAPPAASESPSAGGAGATASPAPSGPAAADTAAAGPDYVLGDVALGDAQAPLTVYEYASFTCPHCASFHEQTFPEFREKYIDTGKVRFILREVYFDQYGLWASMVARCGGEDGFYPLVDAFLASQQTWTRAPDIGHAIQQVGRRAGLPAERLQQCLSDREFAKTLLESYQENREADEIQSTPTFVINGEKHTGAMSFADFSAILDAAL